MSKRIRWDIDNDVIRFRSLLASVIDDEQSQRIFTALTPIMKPTLDRPTLPLV